MDFRQALALFLEQEGDYLLFAGGLGFLLLAATAAALWRKSDRRLAWSRLAVFGLLQGLSDWSAFLTLAYSGDRTAAWVRALLQAAAGLALLDFARASQLRRLGLRGKKWREQSGVAETLPVILFLGAALGFREAEGAAQVLAGCLLSLTGGLAAATVLFLEYLTSRSRGLAGAAAALLLWALGTAVNAEAEWLWPAPLLNRQLSAAATGLTPGAVCALASLGAAFALHRRHEEVRPLCAAQGERPLFICRSGWFAALLFLLLALGWVAAYFVGSRTEAAESAELLAQARVAARSLDTGKVERLSGKPEDARLPEYQELRLRLSVIRTACPGVKHVYLYGWRNDYHKGESDDRERFGRVTRDYVSSVADREEDNTSPGHIYNFMEPYEVEGFDRGQEKVSPPYEDPWGCWISAIVPVLQAPGSSGASVMLGMDFPAEERRRNILLSRWAPIAITLLLILSAAAFHTLTRRILAESLAVKTSLSWKQAVLENSAAGLLVSRGRTIHEANRRLAAMLGYTPSDLQGRDLELLFRSPADCRTAGEEAERLLRAGDAADLELQLVRKDGALLWCRAVGRALEPGAPEQGVIWVFLDITPQKSEEEARKLAEEELRRSLDTLEQTNRQLQEATARAQLMSLEADSANQAKSDFLTHISHELRTPLNGVIGMASLLDTADLVPAQREQVRIIRRSAETLLQLVSNLLDLSRIEAGKLTLESIDFDLRAALEDVLQTVAFRAAEKGLALGLLVASNAPAQVAGDPNRLKQVLLNLVSNAIKFTEHGEITVEAKVERTEGKTVGLRLEVRDTGIGMTAEQQSRLFQPFSQAEASIARKYGGAGLGLSICKRLAEEMGGQLGLESEPGRGSTFWFSLALPVRPAVEPPALRPAELRERTALVIAAHPLDRMVHVRQLETLGIACTAVAGTAEGLERVAQAAEPFDWILLDGEGAKGERAAWAAALREKSKAADTPLVLAVALTEALQAAKAREAGFAAGLVKPVRMELLAACLRELLTRSGDAPPPPLPAVPSGGHPRRVLLADDDAVNRTVVSALLKQLGLAVELASNGAEAVAAAADAPFDAILLDCLMPDPDGFETARRIRNSAPEGPRVPILALTALADGENREKCLAAGMDDFLAKPVTLDQLQRVLAKWLTAPPESGKPGAPPSGPLVLSRVEELRGLLGEQTWRETVESFLSDGRAKLAELRAAWDKKDATGVRDAAHYLKGSSANLGASAVAEAARRIEKAPSAGEVSAEMVERLEERFRDLERVWGGPLKV